MRPFEVSVKEKIKKVSSGRWGPRPVCSESPLIFFENRLPV